MLVESMNSVLVNRQLTAVENVEGFKCFLHCLYNRYNWMDEEGGFLLRNMKSSLEATRLDDFTADWLIFKCSAVHSSDRCDRAFKFTQCFWDETKEHYEDDNIAIKQREGVMHFRRTGRVCAVGTTSSLSFYPASLE
ncbi:hypothetical protein Cfor_05426 [Coptotermes formosanus]|uniref:Odorant binding protein n=1 Tax=Coptotermes formosanus TaxID=36987 RepID=A0A6L2PXS8_COPFO|nr:hypothetical protein Cfor_05426 [Coptotermes formosanus]